MALKPGNYAITCPKGATLDQTFTWKDPNGDPINLTGYTARMQVRKRVEASTVLLDLTIANGGITLGGVAGTIRVQATAAATAAITESDGVYDLELIAGSGAVTRLLEGSFYLPAEVTR